ncbi:hypothetical protein BDF22DRAFT_52151 [Syncephalis plumigaleata]|nr:hypothetical protein BDF22DRAFT_52151 [Syncephalis plumigaleata]
MSRRGRLFKSLDEGGESLLTNAELQQICNTVWTEIRQYTDDSGRRLSELFESLPSKTDYPDYYEVITRPVALETIKHTIDAGGYSSIDAFHADLEQMFTNAKTYNVRGSQVYTDAVALQKLADSYLESYLSNNLMDIDETQPDGASDEYRELLSAISHNDTSRALSMIQQPGFNPNQLGKVEMFGDEFTWGALHCAAYYGNIKVIDALMERGANVEMRDTWHRGTPLAWAAFAGHVDTVRRLVAKYNANIYSKNMHGQVAYDLVSEPEDEAWFNLLTTTRPDKVKRRGRPPKHSVTSTIDQERNQEGGKRYRRQSKSELGSGNESDEEDYMEEEEEEEDEEEEADDMDVADEDEYMNGKRTNRTPSKPKKSSLDGSSITDIASPTIDDTISTPSKATIGTGGGAEFGIDVSNQKRPKSARLLREILYSITEYRDETGRRLAEPFIELPTEEKYPGYQRKVRRLASFNKIENRIKRGYDSFERYERECMRVLDNALLYFKETSQEYKDALFLKDLMKKNIVAIITKYENCTETPAGIDPRIKLDLTGRYTGKSIEVNGVEYTLGEFVYVHDQRDIMIIDRIYLHAE